MATAPTYSIFKFDTTTDATQIPSLTAGTLYASQTGISFNLQIVEKFGATFGTDNVGSTVVGSGSLKFNTTTSRDLANLITRYFDQIDVLVDATDGVGGTGRNIRSMKLIVNVDPSA